MTPSKPDLVALADLRSANKARQAEWDQDNQITLAYRGNELAGEVGEACNVIKKLERERLGIRGSRATKEQLAEELADVVICADLIAMDAGIDLLNEAVPAKFNATSEKVGLNTRLASQPSLYEAGLREALEPFAKIADEYDDAEDVNHQIWTDVHQKIIRWISELHHYRKARAAIAALPADGGEVDYDTNDPMGVEKDIQSSDGGGGSRPALKEERIKTTTVHEDRTTSLAAVRQMAGAAPGPSEATTPSAREALEEIRNMTVNLRSGGPDPMDLQELSDALERATELASELLNSGGF